MPRTIVVGDVHACSDELVELLDRLGYSANDRLFFVGDLIGRGPHPQRVLDLVDRLGAQSVQGNHERRLLEVRSMAGGTTRQARLGPGHRWLASSLRTQDWDLLSALPLVRHLPLQHAAVVHAGIDPRRDLGEQDPWVLTHVRSLESDGSPSHRSGKASWADGYLGPDHIVFGHDALRGLQLHPWATGLDSGCVYGGRLSALVIPDGQGILPVTERLTQIVSVPARRSYFEPRS